MNITEEDLKEICPVSTPPPAPTPDRFPSQCDQSVLKAVIRLSVKRPELRNHKDVKYVLEKIKSNKKIEGVVWDRILQLIS
jgi:hypothetical protein